jgi:hypothetical protein
MVKIVQLLLAAGFLISFNDSGCEAAILSEVEGSAFINTGDGFQPAFAGMTAGPGDRVRTAAGAVVITYENGCSIRVGPHQISVILSVPPDPQSDRGRECTLLGPDWLTVGGIVGLDAGIVAGTIFAGANNHPGGPATPRPASP